MLKLLVDSVGYFLELVDGFAGGSIEYLDFGTEEVKL